MIKTVADSRVIHTRLIMPPDTNSHNTLYGGNLLHMIDSVAAIAFQKHSRVAGVTASIDRVNFIAPLPVAHAMTVEAVVSGVGKTSVEVFVKVMGENLKSSETYLAATAFLTFVVVDKDAPPMPGIKASNEDEAHILEGYEERRLARLKQRELDIAFQNKLHLTPGDQK